ncbi:hypothetical protein Trydic_g21578 [Trypoxylus dichotomus]
MNFSTLPYYVKQFFGPLSLKGTRTTSKPIGISVRNLCRKSHYLSKPHLHLNIQDRLPLNFMRESLQFLKTCIRDETVGERRTANVDVSLCPMQRNHDLVGRVTEARMLNRCQVEFRREKRFITSSSVAY